MSKNELIELVRRIMSAEGTEEELDAMVQLFETNVPHPAGSDLIYYGENYNVRRDWETIGEYDPTPEEVVEKALSYKPLALPQPEVRGNLPTKSRFCP